MTKRLSTILKHKTKEPNSSTLDDFEIYAKNNEIDWDDFLTGETHWFYTYRMAMRGYGLDALVRHDVADSIVQMIRYENGSEYYETLKKHDIYGVRAALAAKGYFPDELIHDENDYVKMAVVEQHPEYIDKVIHLHDYESVINKIIFNEVQVTQNTLKQYKEHYDIRRLLPNYEKAFNLKLSGLNQQEAIVQTMTTEQLYLIDNPAWTRGYSIDQITRLKELEDAIGYKNMHIIAPFFTVDDNWYHNIALETTIQINN